MTASESYYDRIRDSKNPGLYRWSMIDFFFAHGENVSETARAFHTSRPWSWIGSLSSGHSSAL